MKRFFKVFLLMLLVAAFVISIVACSPSSGYTGTYYEYDRNGNKTSDWIKLEKSKWSSSDGENGRLEVKDGAVTAYSEIFGEEEVFFTGTVSDGVLTYSMFEGIEYKAYKDGAYNSNPGKPSNPDTPSSDTFTVTFDSNGGSEVKSVSVHSDGTISAPENPTKAGYNFAGWYSDRNYSNKWSFSTKIRSDITLYAKWEKQIDKYTVTFESNGGSAVGSKQVNDGDKISAPVQPTKKMFVFGGWYKDSDFEEVWDFDTDVVTKNITLYAKWKEEEVRITSVNNATIEDNEITMVVGESIDEVDMNGKIILNHSEATWKLYYDRLGQMEIPTRIAANKNDNPLNSGSNVFYIVVTNKNGTQTKNYILDIYKKYEVKVMVFGLNGITPIDTFTAVTLETMPTPTATVTGYTVIGWESTSVIPGEILPKDAPLAITLTAKLKANTYKLTLDENGGTLENKECNATYDSSVTLPIPEKPGYTFVGWYYRDEKITNGKGETTWTIDRDISLTAKYRANVYSATAEKNMNEAGSVSARGNATSAVLSFDNNGRTGATEIDAQTVTTNFGMTPPTPPKADGYLFTGWFNEPECETIFDFSKNIYRDTTVYAGWYSTGISTKKSYLYEYGNEIQIATSDDFHYIYFAPVTSGTYRLYYKNSNAGSTYAARMSIYNVTERTSVKSETSVTNASYEYYSFTATAGNIYYVCVSKYSSSSTFTCYLTPNSTSSVKGYFRTPDNVGAAGYQSEVTLTATTNTGYTFIGWFDGDTELTKELTYTFTMPAENKTYTAKWIKVNTEANLSEAGSVSELNETYKPGDSATVTATTNPGYTFIGWYDGDTELTKELTYTFTMPAENKTYTAKWIKVSFAKNIAEAGSVSELTETYKPGDSATVTATTNPGYTFIGWFDGDTELTKELTYTFTMPAENKTYTAKWTFYTFSTAKNIDEAGDVTIEAERQYNGILRFDLNGATGTAPSAQTGTATYPDIPTRNGFVFAGWYETPECTGEPFDFTSDITSQVLYAKWIAYSGKGVWQVGHNYSVSVSSKSSSNDYYAFVPLVSGNITFYSSSSWDTYGFLFDANKTKIAENDDGGSNNNFSITYNVTAGTLYYARPAGYNGSGTLTAYLSGTSKPQDGGKIISTENKITAETAVTLTVTTNPGYTFIGWFDGETELTKELTYTFTMPAENKTFTAKWIKVSFSKNITAAGSVSELTETYKPGDSATVTATTNLGYTFIGWFDGDTELTKELTYTFTMPAENKTYTAKWIKVNTETNLSEAGSVSELNETYKLGDSATVIATTNPGYTFIGWFDGETELTKELTYTFTMPAENKTFTAKWTFYTISTETNMPEAGTYTRKDNEKTSAGTDVTMTATTNQGYTFIGWFDGDTELTKELTYTFTMPAENKTYTAKWEIKAEMENFYFTATENSVVITGVKNKTITEVIVPDYVTSIGNYAFSGCTNIETATISTLAISYIPKDKLKTVVITSGASIGNYAFRGCTGLTSVTIPDSVTSIGTDAFYGCTNIETATIPTLAIGYIPKNNLKTVIITSGKSIGNYAFYDYTGLTSVTIPDSVTSIGDCAFRGCTDLTNITIGNSVTSIGTSAFYGCTGLTSITIPDSVTSIGDYAFYGCTGLTSITIPDSVTSIGEKVFYYCTGLTSVTIGNGVTSIGSSAFYDCTGLTSVTIPDSVTSIGTSAFSGCTDLTNITIGNSVTSIGNSAFYGCTGLTSITIPDSVTSIGEKVFYYCKGLTSVTIGNGVTSIGFYAFEECYKLVEVYNKSSLNITAGSEDNGCVGYYAKAVYTEEYTSKLSTDENGYIIYTDG